MEFRTIVDINGGLPRIEHHNPIMMLGSCFTENIGGRLERGLFDIEINPFGTLYNPASIAAALRRLLEDKEFQADELFFHGGIWHSFDHHSRFSSADRSTALEKINESYRRAVQFLRNAKVLILTFGTAYVYRLAESDRIVANCHKLPPAAFRRIRMTTEEIISEWQPLLGQLRRTNPEMQIIFTVSPIRHLADGAHGNQLSKSALLLAVGTITENCSFCSYFPSYEIVLDELRDYRFYAADMVHPSDIAVDYIMERFAGVCFSDACRDAAKECGKLSRMLRHRPLTDDPVAAGRFNGLIRQEALRLTEKMPYLKRTIENKFPK